MEARDRFSGEVKEVPFLSQRHLCVGVKKEKFDSFTRTERGYVPPTVQIADMMNAGLRLAAERRARFDSQYVKEGEEVPLDPTREPGVDLVDMGRLAEKAKNAATAFEEAVRAKEKEASDAARQAEINAAVEKALQEKALKEGK